jgi:hypothetical protein
MALCLTSRKRCQRWGTPPALLQILDEQYHFTRNPDGTLFDPCPIDWDPDTHPDGLSIDWAPSTFINPPYTGVADWLRKAALEAQKGNQSVLLLNAVTDSVWFHTYCYKQPGVKVRFLRGRVPFVDPSNPKYKVANPSPSMLVIFRPHQSRCHDQKLGEVGTV